MNSAFLTELRNTLGEINIFKIASLHFEHLEFELITQEDIHSYELLFIFIPRHG